MGIPNSAVTAILNGGRQIKANEVPKIRKYFKLDSVPIRGLASAGDRIAFFSLEESEPEYVPALENSTLDTVAVEIRGDSLGAALNGWVAYYDNVQRPVTDDLLNELCVLGLSDGSVQIKKVQRSRNKRFVHLVSNTGSQETDVPRSAIEWAAKVTGLRPKRG